jgi:hypothetical protein
VSGITYGANGVWPWLREGEEILNHASKGESSSRWKESLALPGSVQVGYLSVFFQKLERWKLKPAPDLLTEQPGDSEISQFISIAESDDGKTIVSYLPAPRTLSIYNRANKRYEAQWFDPVANKISKGTVTYLDNIVKVASPSGKNDHVLVLQQTK